MKNTKLESYKKLVRRKLAALNSIFARAILGDFTGRVNIPHHDDEFTNLYVGVETMLEVIRRQLRELDERSKELKQKLQEREFQSLQDEAILDSIGEGLLVTDESERIVIVNARVAGLLGFRKEELVGRTPAEVFSMENEKGEIIPASQHPLQLAMAHGKTVRRTHYLRRKNGSVFPAAITATPLLLAGQIIGGVKVFRDTTEETAISKAKTEFVSLASHQLRTPLTMVKWYTSHLLDTWDNNAVSPEEKRKYLEDVYSTNQRMTDLVGAILNVSKIDLGTLAVEPQAVHLENIAKEVITELQVQIAEKKLRIRQEFGVSLPAFNADPHLMRIVFQNLLTNAIKYTPPHGVITCSLIHKNKCLMLQVSDTGCGISKKDAGKIFSKFYRTEVARNIDPNGNGLGMYIVKAIVREARGKIWFHSKEGQGTTFYVILPMPGMQKKQGVKGLSESFS